MSGEDGHPIHSPPPDPGVGVTQRLARQCQIWTNVHGDIQRGLRETRWRCGEDETTKQFGMEDDISESPLHYSQWIRNYNQSILWQINEVGKHLRMLWFNRMILMGPVSFLNLSLSFTTSCFPTWLSSSILLRSETQLWLLVPNLTCCFHVIAPNRQFCKMLFDCILLCSYNQFVF